jgi:Rrf2 family protein
MQLNQATDYGFRAALHLAGHPGGEWVDAPTIACAEAIPIRYLLKIMPYLTKAGIIKSQRGSGGGYALARSPGDITLLDIIIAIEGPLHLNRCLLDASLCSKEGPPHCKVHQALALIQRRLGDEFSRYHLADLLD